MFSHGDLIPLPRREGVRPHSHAATMFSTSAKQSGRTAFTTALLQLQKNAQRQSYL